MIARTAIAIDVDNKTPFVPMRIGSDGRIFSFLTSRITFLGVVGYGVCEFAGGGLGLWLPVDWDGTSSGGGGVCIGSGAGSVGQWQDAC